MESTWSKTTKEQQKNKTHTNIVPRERLADENGWQHYVYHKADTNVHYLRDNPGYGISMIFAPKHKFS